MKFPEFKYHPDPISTGSIVESDETCCCCQEKRGYSYVSSFYFLGDLEGSFCPWCIADGSAAKKFKGVFSDAEPLLTDGVRDEVVNEVCLRTPSFDSWQQEVWLSHCNDAGAFMGFASKSDFQTAIVENQAISGAEHIPKSILKSICDTYAPDGHPSIYKFVCTKCEVTLLHLDST